MKYAVLSFEYGVPAEMVFTADTFEECEKFISQYVAADDDDNPFKITEIFES